MVYTRCSREGVSCPGKMDELRVLLALLNFYLLYMKRRHMQNLLLVDIVYTLLGNTCDNAFLVQRFVNQSLHLNRQRRRVLKLQRKLEESMEVAR